MFPLLCRFLATDPEALVNPRSARSSQVIVDQPTWHEITRAANCPTWKNWSSDETNGTFTVFVRLAVCVVSWP